MCPYVVCDSQHSCAKIYAIWLLKPLSYYVLCTRYNTITAVHCDVPFNKFLIRHKYPDIFIWIIQQSELESSLLNSCFSCLRVLTTPLNVFLWRSCVNVSCHWHHEALRRRRCREWCESDRINVSGCRFVTSCRRLCLTISFYGLSPCILATWTSYLTRLK